MRGHAFSRVCISCLATLLVSCLGCLPSDGSRLIGRWEGQLQPVSSAAESRASSGGGLSEAVMQIQTDVSAVRVSLDCQATRFAMALDGPDGSTDRKTGRWSVLESRGSRWLVEFAPEDATDPIRLQIVFRDVNEFTARELAGDDRLGAWSFRRLTAAAGAGGSAKSTDERN